MFWKSHLLPHSPLFQVVRPARRISYLDLIYKTSTYMKSNATYKPTTIVLTAKLLNSIFPPAVRLIKRAVTSTNALSTSNSDVVRFILYRNSALFPGVNVPVEVRVTAFIWFNFLIRQKYLQFFQFAGDYGAGVIFCGNPNEATAWYYFRVSQSLRNIS